jgi:hypothetical protein
MNDDERAARMNELALRGFCCTQALVQVALDELGVENEQMVDAVAALCVGMFSGADCGALAGGALAMALRGSPPFDGALVAELVDWFRGEYGALACCEILSDDPLDRYTKCPPLMVRTYETAMRILADRGKLSS